MGRGGGGGGGGVAEQTSCSTDKKEDEGMTSLDISCNSPVLVFFVAFLSSELKFPNEILTARGNQQPKITARHWGNIPRFLSL